MAQQEEKETPVKKEPPKFRGLYDKVNISVKSLDRIIFACIAVIVITLAINLKDPGFVVTFDSQGGTPVEPTKYQYNEVINDVEDPTREGYEFTGWYMDPDCTLEWNDDTKVIQETKLYAGWKKKE